jgi:hypothetical protein
MSQSFCNRCQATVFAVETGGVSVCPQCNTPLGADDRQKLVTPAFAPKSSSTAKAEDEPKKPSRLLALLSVRTVITLVLSLVVIGFAFVVLTRESPASAFDRIQANAAGGKWGLVWDRIDNRSQTRLHESMRTLLDRTIEAATLKEEDLEQYRPMKEYPPRRLFATMLEKHDHTRKLLARRYVVDSESEGDGVRLQLSESPNTPATDSVLMVKEAGVWKLSVEKEAAERFAIGPALPPPPPPPPEPEPEPEKRAEGLNQWMRVGNVEVCVSQVGVGKLKLHPIDNTITSGKDDVLLVEVKIRQRAKGKVNPYKSWQQRYHSGGWSLSGGRRVPRSRRKSPSRTYSRSPHHRGRTSSTSTSTCPPETSSRPPSKPITPANTSGSASFGRRGPPGRSSSGSRNGSPSSSRSTPRTCTSTRGPVVTRGSGAATLVSATAGVMRARPKRQS